MNQKSNPKIPALDDTRPAILGRVAVTTTAKDSRAFQGVEDSSEIISRGVIGDSSTVDRSFDNF